MYEMKVLSERKVNVKETNHYFESLLTTNPTDAVPAQGRKSHLKLVNTQADSIIPNERAYKKLQAMYNGQGRGAELTAAKDLGQERPQGSAQSRTAHLPEPRPAAS